MTLVTHDPRTFPERPLPTPTDTRFRPLRAGILNVWEYDDQEFWFEDGRLVLRGGNEAGKSKALEVLLPFLLDADMSPQRLDPFGARSKTMRWNLLEFDPGRKNAVGYTWLEFGRREHGEEDFVTIGAGMRASAQTRDVRSWFFVARGRPGRDFDLVADREPLTRRRLMEALGEDGRVFERAGDYREAVDRTLFGLGAERYGALVHLLLQLRRPQLSANLEPAELSAVLRESLPPLDEGKIAALSRAFDRLETDAEELRTLQASRTSLEEFLAVYRSYARQHARARAAAVRSAFTRLDGVTRRVREAAEERDATRVEIEGIAAERGDGIRRAEDLEVELRALADSDEMRQAARLDRAREELHRAEEGFGEAARSESEVRAEEEHGRVEREETGARAERARHAREEAGFAARDAADAAASLSRHDALREGFEERPAQTAELLLRAARDRAEEIRRLRHLSVEVGRAEDRLGLERRQEDEARARVTEAEQAAVAADGREEAAREGLEREAAGWFGSPDVPDVPEEAVERAVEEALGLAAEGAPTRGAAERAVAPVEEGIEAETADVRAGIAREEERVGALAAERARVEAEAELPPPLRAGRAPDRSARAGETFYRLVDFRDELPEVARSGLEASLEAAGVLDAFVTPDGRSLDSGTLDVLFVPESGPAPGRTLADVLAPVASDEVGTEAIGRLLGSVALVDAGEEEPETGDYLGLDGRYRVGPLSGRWAKESPEFIGAAAREAARSRRLAEIDEEIAGLRAALESLRARRADLEAVRQAIRQAVAAFPDGGEFRRARAAAADAAAELVRAGRQLEAARERSAAAERERDRRRVELETAARRAGLEGHLGDLETLATRLEAYRTSVQNWREQGRVALERIAAAERAAERAAWLADRVARAEESRERIEGEARRLRVEVQTLTERFGKAAEEVLARQDAAKRELETIRRRREELEIAAGVAQKRLGAAEAALAAAESERQAREAERQAAIDALGGLLSLGILAVALDEDLEPLSATVTAAIDLARRIESETGDAGIGREDLDAGENRLHGGFQTLRTSLGGDFDPALDREDGVTCVTVAHNGRLRTLPDLIGELAAEVAKRRELLEEGERELIERHLLGEVGHHLQERVAAARALVTEMNDELSRHPTNFGRRVKIEWTPTEDDAETRAALRVLEKDVRVLSETEREGLVRFLRGRIGRSREDEGAGSGADRLARVLDYRGWHEFVVAVEEEGRVRRLTKRVHGTGSGGSRAVLIHLPLFAAAAAHYRSASPTAPHLVMLDEAFAGIDPDQRGSLMGLLVSFGLDFLLTNHEEWGCYREVPGLAVYHLERRPGHRGVAAIRFVWNGTGHREEDPWLSGRTGEFEW